MTMLSNKLTWICSSKLYYKTETFLNSDVLSLQREKKYSVPSSGTAEEKQKCLKTAWMYWKITDLLDREPAAVAKN